MGIRDFKDYHHEYQEFYDAVFILAKMEDKFLSLKRKVTFSEAKKYQELYQGIMSQCPEGTDIEDLIGLVVVAETKKKKKIE
jgi:hypothetical protein